MIIDVLMNELKKQTNHKKATVHFAGSDEDVQHHPQRHRSDWIPTYCQPCSSSFDQTSVSWNARRKAGLSTRRDRWHQETQVWCCLFVYYFFLLGGLPFLFSFWFIDFRWMSLISPIFRWFQVFDWDGLSNRTLAAPITPVVSPSLQQWHSLMK